MKMRMMIVTAIMVTLAGITQVQALATETMPPLVKQINNGNWPSDSEAQELV